MNTQKLGTCQVIAHKCVAVHFFSRRQVYTVHAVPTVGSACRYMYIYGVSISLFSYPAYLVPYAVVQFPGEFVVKCNSLMLLYV